MKENKNMIEQALGSRAPAADGQSEAGGELAALANELFALMQSGDAPAGFDLEAACRDEGFAALAGEFGVAAAVRIWAAERRAAEAEENAMARVSRQVQQRRALPQSASGGGSVSPRQDYAHMDSAAFKKLSQEFRRRARNGERIPL